MPWKHNGRTLKAGKAWVSDSGVKHPAIWMRWSDSEKKDNGLTWEDPPASQEPFDERFYWGRQTDGSLIEKMKYDYLIKNCGTKIPGYVCRFKDGSYWAWNLKKINEPKWYDKKLPETTHFERKEWINKKVGDLTLQEGVKLI